MSEQKPVRVAAIHIKNVLGITEAEIRPGRITVIEGKNGAGKSSILESINAVLQGGHDGTLVRNGSDRGVFFFKQKTAYEITKRITPEKSDVAVKHPEFGKLAKQRTYIDRLCDAFALNPVDFLIAKKEK